MSVTANIEYHSNTERKHALTVTLFSLGLNVANPSLPWERLATWILLPHFLLSPVSSIGVASCLQDYLFSKKTGPPHY